MNADLRKAYEFFRGKTGCVGHDAEVSINLARAELRAATEGYTYEWQVDNDVYGHGEGCEDHSHFGCILRGPAGDDFGSLWSICFEDDHPSGWYRRYVEAELASEHFASEDATARMMHL